MTVVFSRRDAEHYTPPGSPRAYTIAPLTFRERQAFRAELAQAGGVHPGIDQLMAAMRAAVRSLGASNEADLLAAIDLAEAEPANADAQSVLGSVEAICAEVPAYAALLAARVRYRGLLPWVAARHALRGWEGPRLPPFQRERGLVPEALLDLLPTDEMEAVGMRAADLMQPAATDAHFSEAPSPSPASPAPSTEG
jgi:hypothetical protein